jgi:hypothetical protein
LTCREKHVLVIWAFTVWGLIISEVDQQTLNAYEVLWLIFLRFALGLNFATNPAHNVMTVFNLIELGSIFVNISFQK